MSYYGHRKKRKRIRSGSLLLLLLLCALFLVSCVTGSNTLWVKGVLGLDLTDYRAEQVERVHPTDGSVAALLCEGVEVFTVSSLSLKPFSKPADAIDYYRDEILNNMLRDGYSYYTGNAKQIARVGESYPNLTVSTLIPTKDFEDAALRYFGAQRVRHESGELFNYLERADCYNFSMKAWERSVEVVPESIEETYHTYRFRFRLTDGSNTSELYRAVFVKRSDGTCYIRALELQ